jgi:hypothetical protein
VRFESDDLLKVREENSRELEMNCTTWENATNRGGSGIRCDGSEGSRRFKVGEGPDSDGCCLCPQQW